MVDQAFFYERMILCQQRCPAQCSCCNKHDQSDKSQRHSKIPQYHRYLCLTCFMIGHRTSEYHLEKIQPMSEYDQQCHKGHRCIISLRTSSHQYQYRCNKVDDEHQPEHTTVRSACSWFEISCFFRLVTVPDQHEL